MTECRNLSNTVSARMSDRTVSRSKPNGFGQLRSWVSTIQRTDLPGISSAWPFTLLPLRDRGDVGATQQYLVIFFDRRGGRQHRFFLKQYLEPQRQGALEHEFLSLRLVSEALSETDSFRAPQPYAWNEEYRVLLTEYYTGSRLDTSLVRSLRIASPLGMWIAPWIVSRVARLLRTLQNVPVPLNWTSASDPKDVATRYAGDLDRRLWRCREVGLPEALLDHVRAFVGQHLTTVSRDFSIVFQHSDFSPLNMLVNGNRLIVLDLNNATAGIPLYDLAFFYTWLALYRHNRTLIGGRVAKTQSCFLGSFDGDVRNDWLSRSKIPSAPYWRSA